MKQDRGIMRKRVTISVGVHFIIPHFKNSNDKSQTIYMHVKTYTEIFKQGKKKTLIILCIEMMNIN